MKSLAAGVIAVAVSLSVVAGAQDIVLVDATSKSGVDFVHEHGGCGKRRFVEQLGGGVALFDFDGDRRLDIFLTSGTTLPGCPRHESRSHASRLYRGLGDLRFQDVTDASLSVDPGYATGCAAGDVDNDGDEDLFVACVGPNRLYRNDGAGHLVDVSAQAFASTDGANMSASATFLDADLDGDLDLYVANYVDVPSPESRCEQRGLHAYCQPQEFRAVPDRLLRNDGTGRFEDVTRESGVLKSRGRGLGVAASDFNGDGLPDIYVANDATDNFLFRRRRPGDFRTSRSSRALP